MQRHAPWFRSNQSRRRRCRMPWLLLLMFMNCLLLFEGGHVAIHAIRGLKPQKHMSFVAPRAKAQGNLKYRKRVVRFASAPCLFNLSPLGTHLDLLFTFHLSLFTFNFLLFTFYFLLISSIRFPIKLQPLRKQFPELCLLRAKSPNYP